LDTRPRRLRRCDELRLREFNGAIKIAPGKAQIAWLNTAHPDARLHTFIKHGNSRWRETKWLGNYRYAIVSLGGIDRADLDHRFADVCRNVSFERDFRVRFAPDVTRCGRAASAFRDQRSGIRNQAVAAGNARGRNCGSPFSDF
jgi:hypothetical protein